MLTVVGTCRNVLHVGCYRHLRLKSKRGTWIGISRLDIDTVAPITDIKVMYTMKFISNFEVRLEPPRLLCEGS